MAKESLSRRLAVILHADIAGSTVLVQKNETLAHKQIQDAFNRFSIVIKTYGGETLEHRGDALVAEFDRASDAVTAALSFQVANAEINAKIKNDIKPQLRIGISLGEVVVADKTVTGVGVVLAQRLEQLADTGGIVVQGAVTETMPIRMPYEFENLGEQILKGFDRPVRAFAARLKPGSTLPQPEPKASPRNVRLVSSNSSRVGMATLGILLFVLIGISGSILLDKPPEVRILDYLTARSEKTLSQIWSKLEVIPVLLRQVEFGSNDEVKPIAEVAILGSDLQPGSLEPPTARNSLVFLELKAFADKKKQVELERRIVKEIKQAELDRQAAEKKRQTELASKAAEEKRQAELNRRAAEKKKQLELDRKTAEKIIQAELARKEIERTRQAVLDRQAAEQKKQAELERQAAEQNKQAELDSQEKAKRIEAMSLLSTGDEYFKNRDYVNAKIQYQGALDLNPGLKEQQLAAQSLENAKLALLVLKASDVDLLLSARVVGNYRSDMPTGPFRKRSRIKVKLEMQGTRITGTISGTESGKIEGSLEGDEIKFEWWVVNPYPYHGRGKWKVTSDKTRLRGSWTGYTGDGKWNLTKIE